MQAEAYDPLKKYRFSKNSAFHIVPGSLWAELKTVSKGLSGNDWDDIYEENYLIKEVRDAGGVFVNDTFIPLVRYNQGVMFLDGGYGSSKTTFVITLLLVRCMEEKQFKCFYGRMKKTEARELHDNIIREIKRNGWDELFDYSEKPNGSPDIKFKKNDNIFKLFGCDDVDSLKGIDNATCIFVDEINQISFAAFGMLLTRLRTPGVRSQMIGCFNNCDVYPDHWLAKYIYGGETPKDNMEAILLEALMKSNIIKHHSTYLDNKVQNHAAYLQQLIIKANGDPDKIKAYCDGDWGVKLNSQPFYKMFAEKNHVRDAFDDKRLVYDPTLPLHIGFDENVNPYLPCLICQIHGDTLYMIDEIAAQNPYNTIDWVCDQLIEKYGEHHKSTVFIYGDATSKKEDVKMEKGKNLYTKIVENLKMFKVELRVPDSNPNNSMRGRFLNSIFGIKYAGLDIVVGSGCLKMREDLQHCEEDPSGNGKNKKKVTVNGIAGVQKYGHFGDIMDYIVCELWSYQYALYQTTSVVSNITYGDRVVNNTMAKAEKKLSLIGPAIDIDEDDDDDEADGVYSSYGYKGRRTRHGY